MDNKDSLLSGVKILVVDDEPDALAITRLMLTFYQALVIETSNSVLGLEYVQSHRPDVIVSDISMPLMDGYRFIREVRNLPPHEGGQTPAIALTAFNRPVDKTRAINAGFQRHLSKPVKLEMLIDTVAILAGQARVLSH